MYILAWLIACVKGRKFHETEGLFFAILAPHKSPVRELIYYTQLTYFILLLQIV